MWKSIVFLIILQLFSSSWAAEEGQLQDDVIGNCAAVVKSGVYSLKIPHHNSNTHQVFCDQETNYGGWTLVLNRFKGKLDFHDRTWNEYVNGFGRFDREYFIGLELLNLLTTTRTHSMLILMKDFDDVDYSTSVVEFEIDNESSNYALNHVQKFYGTEIGFLEYGTRFCSIDVPMCAYEMTGWYLNGNNSKITKNRLNLFGPYLKIGGSIEDFTMGFFNEVTKKVNPLRSIKMLMRPVNIFRNSYGDTFSKLH